MYFLFIEATFSYEYSHFQTLYSYFSKLLHVCCVTLYNLFPTLNFYNFEKHRFHHVLFSFSMKWHPYFKEPTSSSSPVGIVSPSKGHPTFKAMRFSMVNVKILSTESQIADSNNNGGFVLFLLHKESTFARSIRHMNAGSKAMWLLTKVSVQAHPRRESSNFFLSSLPRVLCQCWNMHGILAEDIYCLNLLSTEWIVSFPYHSLLHVFPSLSFKHFICMCLSGSL